MNVKEFRILKDSLNKIKFLKMEPYKIGHVLSIPIAYIDLDVKYNIFRLLLSFFYSILTIPYNNRIVSIGNGGKKDVFFYFSHIYSDRKDYTDAVNAIKELFPARTELNGQTVNRKFYFSSLKNIWLLPVWLYQIKGLPYSFDIRLNIVVNTFEAKRWLDYLKKTVKPEDHSILITFFDARLHDNIIAQYFKLHKIPTATLQHGHFNAAMPAVKNKSKKFGIAFEGFISDKFLAWGEYTKNEAIKNGIDAQRIVCVGSPKYIGYLHRAAEGPSDVFGVVLEGGGKNSEAANIEMISIANAFARARGMRYVIKPHPVSDISVFDSHIQKEFLARICGKSESVEEYSDSVSFSIAMGSSVYAELLYMKANVFRYIAGEGFDCYEQIKWGSFRSAEELLELYGLQENNPEYVAEMNRLASDMLFKPGNIEQNYKRVIEEMCSGSTVV